MVTYRLSFVHIKLFLDLHNNIVMRYDIGISDNIQIRQLYLILKHPDRQIFVVCQGVYKFSCKNYFASFTTF